MPVSCAPCSSRAHVKMPDVYFGEARFGLVVYQAYHKLFNAVAVEVADKVAEGIFLVLHLLRERQVAALVRPVCGIAFLVVFDSLVIPVLWRHLVHSAHIDFVGRVGRIDDVVDTEVSADDGAEESGDTMQSAEADDGDEDAPATGSYIGGTNIVFFTIGGGVVGLIIGIFIGIFFRRKKGGTV